MTVELRDLRWVRGGFLSLDDACKRYQLHDRIILLPSDNIAVEMARTNKQEHLYTPRKKEVAR